MTRIIPDEFDNGEMQTNILIYSAVVTSLISLSSARSGAKVQRKENTPALSFLSHLYGQQAPLADLNPPAPIGTPGPSSTDSERLPPAALVPPIAMPAPEPSSSPPDRSSSIILSDVLPKTSRVNIFAGFSRDISTVSDRLENQSANTTVLAPLNSALQALPRKPWEDDGDYARLGANAYAGDEGEDRAHWNLRRFVESHVVTTSPWKEGEKAKTMGGQEVWWQAKNGKKVLLPGEIEVDSVQEKVSNGEVWVLKGVLDYAR